MCLELVHMINMRGGSEKSTEWEADGAGAGLWSPTGYQDWVSFYGLFLRYAPKDLNTRSLSWSPRYFRSKYVAMASQYEGGVKRTYLCTMIVQWNIQNLKNTSSWGLDCGITIYYWDRASLHLIPEKMFQRFWTHQKSSWFRSIFRNKYVTVLSQYEGDTQTYTPIVEFQDFKH